MSVRTCIVEDEFGIILWEVDLDVRVAMLIRVHSIDPLGRLFTYGEILEADWNVDERVSDT